MEFFECLPVIEHLTTSCYLSEYGLHVSVPEELPNSLIHLKYFCFKEMMVEESDEWTFLSVLIHCSPNLEKIKLEMLKDVDDCFEESITFEEYSDFWLEHLNELEIEGFRNYKTELDFVKVILARSPNLKKVVLRTWMHDKDKELETLTILLSAPCASPVKIIVKNDCRAQP
ncbi:putative FBD domain-containing protein [Helianthus annuus]|nr:putative FBD domain-containing protein [Helianthus annuus]KAJ0432720.1 putative FBD domain-containing protein [Helianthus annuus]KAJ0446937.1 putative FBD domain-containing protein [Helianthus annuus]KAJ0631842.1 putative FBD domain-containing protein [Helianthus annuus]KAJ0635737.1 putative FBD domain-containing protein [Helianthus annuus]